MTIPTSGQFSRRHQTCDAHDAARERYKATRGREARKARARQREARTHDKTEEN